MFEINDQSELNQPELIKEINQQLEKIHQQKNIQQVVVYTMPQKTSSSKKMSIEIKIQKFYRKPRRHCGKIKKKKKEKLEEK